jgi:hypothetical protein
MRCISRLRGAGINRFCDLRPVHGAGATGNSHCTQAFVIEHEVVKLSATLPKFNLGKMPLQARYCPRRLTMTCRNAASNFRRKGDIVASSQPIFVPFVPIRKTPDYDLRLYEAYPAATCFYQRRDEGFLKLGSYMSGANASQVHCLETQPIVMKYGLDGIKTMSVMVAPRAERKQGDAPLAAPLPTKPGVDLDVAGGELVASMRFDGNATQEACERTRSALIDCLQRDGLSLSDDEAAGVFRLAQYGPLHSLSTRVNEIWLSIKMPSI